MIVINISHGNKLLFHTRCAFSQIIRSLSNLAIKDLKLCFDHKLKIGTEHIYFRKDYLIFLIAKYFIIYISWQSMKCYHLLLHIATKALFC